MNEYQTERRQDYPKILERLARIEERQIAFDIRQVAIDKRINGSIDKMEKHIDEGDKPGGYRERLTKLETTVLIAAGEKLNSIKAAQYRIGIIAGTPGIVLAILKIIDLLIKH